MVVVENDITMVVEKVAVVFKPSSFVEEISNYYFNDNVDSLYRNESELLLEVRVNEYSRSEYEVIDFEYVEELEELIAEAKGQDATLLKIRCEA